MAQEAGKRKVVTRSASLRVEGTPPRIAIPKSVEKEPHIRARELRWLEKNRGKLAEKYAGQWVVLERDKVISHSRDAAAALNQARAEGISIPFLWRVPSKDEGPLALRTNHV